VSHLRHHLREFIILGIIGVFLLGSAQVGNAIGFERVIELLKTNPVTGAVIYVVYGVISVVIITLPIVPLWPVALFIYSFWIAVLLSLLGNVFGATINFLLARKFGKPLVIKMMGKKLFEEIEHLINVDDRKTFFLMRLFGSNYFDPISYLAGLSKMSFSSFFVITFVTSGIWISGMLYVISRLGGLDNIKGFLSIMGVYGSFILIGTIIWKIFHNRHLKHLKNI
jgi:uncharacterized membrane protein YdjX (TVP38/TMEM64 family)